MLHLFSRPYPSSISGVVNSFDFDMNTQTFQLTYTPATSATNYTIISINEDFDAGWGEWLVGLERPNGGKVDEGRVKLEKVAGSVRVWVMPGWQGDLRIVLKQKSDVTVLG